MPDYRTLLAAALVGVIGAGSLFSEAQAQENQWGFGSDIGLTAGTVNGTVFNLGFNLDYYPDRNFSFGPMMQITPTGDLFQFSFAGIGKYHVRLDNGINIVPFTGIGLLHNSLERGTGPGRIDHSDTSWYIPIGVSLEYLVSYNLALSSTIIVNLHDIDLTPSLAEADKTSVALLFGFRWGP